MRYLTKFACCLFGLGIGSAAQAQDVSLSALSNCADLSSLATFVDTTPFEKTLSCRSPQTLPEFVLMSKSQSVTGKYSTCLLSSPPSPSLTSFSCVFERYNSPKSASLTCFRPYAIDIVRKLEANFRNQYKTQIKAYEGKISSCAVSNGDATAFPNSQFWGLASWIFRPEFVISTGLGREGAIPRGMALHAFGAVSPMVKNATGQGGGEVIDVYFGAAPNAAAQGRRAANAPPDKLVSLDMMEASDQSTEAARMFLGSSAGMVKASVDLVVNISSGSKRAEEIERGNKRTDIVENLENIAVAAVKDQGFIELSEKELFSQPTGFPFRSFREMRDLFVPFGSFYKLDWVGSPRVFAKVSQNCGADPVLSSMVYITASKASQYTFTEIGGLSMNVIELESCVKSGTARSTVNAIKQNLKAGADHE